MKTRKKRTLAAMLAALFLLTAPVSCKKKEVELNLDEWITPETGVQADLYAPSSSWAETPWLVEETVYHYDENGDNTDGLAQWIGGRFEPHGNRLYFHVPAHYSDDKGSATWHHNVYLDPLTGVVHDICPDPLCSHLIQPWGDCPYQGLTGMLFDPENDNVFYTTTGFSAVGFDNFPAGLYRVDLSKNQFTCLYELKKPDSNPDNLTDGEYDYSHMTLNALDRSLLTFTVTHYYDEEKTGARREYTSDMTFNVSTGALCVLREYGPDDSPDAHRFDEPYLAKEDGVRYYKDISKGRLYAIADRAADDGEETVLFTWNPDDGESLQTLYYEENEKALYLFAMLRDPDYQNDLLSDAPVGKLFRVDVSSLASGAAALTVPEPELLSLTDTPLAYFVMTRDYYYYIKFEPTYYGTSYRSGTPLVEPFGDKIYRIARSDRSARREARGSGEEETVFDGHGTIVAESFSVVGDYLYLSAKKLISTGSSVYFRVLNTFRVYGKEGETSTIRWIN